MNMSRRHPKLNRSSIFRVTVLAFVFVLITTLPYVANAETTGSVSGQIVNGTSETPLVEATVTISRFDQKPENGQLPPSVDTTTTTDANGHYSFTGLDTATGLVYAVSITYKNIVYSSGMIQLSETPQQTSDITVFDTTTDPTSVTIQSRGILLSGIDRSTGILQITDVYSLENSSKMTFVAGENGRSLQFEVPNNAAEVSPRAGFDFGTPSIEGATVFATSPLRPGLSNPAAFNYTVPYSGSSVSLPISAAYPTESLRVLIPTSDTDPTPTVTVSGAAVLDGGVVSIGDAPYHVWSLSGLTPGQTLTVTFGSLPKANAAPQLRTLEPSIIVLVLVLGAAGVAGGFVFKRRLYLPRPVQVAATAAAPLNVRRQALSDKLRALEAELRDGDITQDVYQRQRRAILEELRMISRAMRGMGPDD